MREKVAQRATAVLILLCFVFKHSLCVFIYKEHIKMSNLAALYLGSTIRTNQVALNAVYLFVSL